LKHLFLLIGLVSLGVFANNYPARSAPSEVEKSSAIVSSRNFMTQSFISLNKLQRVRGLYRDLAHECQDSNSTKTSIAFGSFDDTYNKALSLFRICKQSRMLCQTKILQLL
jgi:hypothetical protein